MIGQMTGDIWHVFNNLGYLHWLTLAFLLLISCIVLSAELLIWLAIGAALVAGITFIYPEISPEHQIVVFSVVSLLVTYLWVMRYQSQLLSRSESETDKATHLANKKTSLIGVVTTLEDNFAAPYGRIKIGDSTWKAQSDVDIPQGENVKVVKVIGTTVFIQKVTD
ncbi:NfeD family protein [Vibrio tubiashii]|uniref:NfeD family protein n=1 Tax=Vibrio tubiashii TaxID=29498 RepID=UPI001EFC6581|nr:NfeD family protein [Vibrio tubiashii]MCG9576092.1 NfeD family protein [Vibrio tubiashii]